MHRRNLQGKLHSLAEILFSISKKRGLPLHLEEKALLKNWPKAVGPQIAIQTKAEALKNGVLFIKTVSPVWAHQLHFIKEDIRNKFNDISGAKIVREIRFSLGHETDDFQNNPDDVIFEKNFSLSERDNKMITECTKSFSDRELASIFKRVMRGEISRRRQIQSRQVHER
ncbi:MAG TPA: DUF721 domain-containing protein [Deltaproteobacteria bacterium]|nr:DUF721 domain-containing protein [Deltaproteobacteria bacterium]